MILGLCPKPHRSALAILKANPHALRYRLMAMRPYIKASQSGARYCLKHSVCCAVICRQKNAVSMKEHASGASEADGALRQHAAYKNAGHARYA